MSLFSSKITPKGKTYNFMGIKIKLKDFYLPVNKLKAPAIHFVHVCEPRNPGDMLSYPYLYFENYFKHFTCYIHHTKDIKYENIKAQDIVILASGGCFEVLDQFQDNINRLLDTCKNVVSWGCGHNAHKGRDVYWPIDFDKFKLLSVRDFNYNNQRYVPCVSCMLPQLEDKFPIQRRIGIIEHQDFPIAIEGKKINHKQGIKKIIEFIGSSEVIITNTYHCAYWAMCMNKKIILYQPFSSKFDNFQHQPIIYSGDLEQDIKQSQNYPNFLAESRKLNFDFFADVKSLIEEVRKQ